MIYNCKSTRNQAGLFDRTLRAYHPTVKKPTVDPVHAAGRRLCGKKTLTPWLLFDSNTPNNFMYHLKINSLDKNYGACACNYGAFSFTTFSSSSVHCPACRTLCTGILPPWAGNMRAKVCSPDGYFVMWPNLLTEAVSAAKIKPYLPPLIVASMFEQGSVIWASPEVNATNLIGWDWS